MDALGKMSLNIKATISAHGRPSFKEQDLLNLPHINTINPNNDDEENEAPVWLRIDRIFKNKPPSPGTLLMPWILKLTDNPFADDRPKLTDSITLDPYNTDQSTADNLSLANIDTKASNHNLESLDATHTEDKHQPNGAFDNEPTTVTLKLIDFPDISLAFDEYLTKWDLWAKAEIPRRKTIEIYDKLFSIMQDVESSGTEDPIEVVWGAGIVVWKSEYGRIEYPLLTQRVELLLEENLTLTISPSSSDPKIESELYHRMEIPGIEKLDKRCELYLQDPAAPDFTPTDPLSFESIPRFAAGVIDPHGIFWPEENDPSDRVLPKPSKEPIITDTWVIYAKERDTNYILEDVRNIRKKVEDTTGVKSAAGILVTEPPDDVIHHKPSFFRGISTSGLGIGVANSEKGTVSTASSNMAHMEESPQDLYFPLPFNNEQVSIIDRLNKSDGVVTQGPPGTGKSHSIVNIACHYLALGKRVLITSHQEGALQVLRDLFPKPLQALTISLLSSDREGLRQVEESVRTIATKVPSLDIHELSSEINHETSRMEHLHEQLIVLDRELRSWGEKQTQDIPFLSDRTKPQELAITVASDREKHSWFPDSLDVEKAKSPIFGSDDIDRLRTLREKLNHDLVYIEEKIPSTSELPQPEEMARIHENIKHFQTLEEKIYNTRHLPPFIEISEHILTQAKELQPIINNYFILLNNSLDPWMFSVRKFFIENNQTERSDENTDEKTIPQLITKWMENALELEKRRKKLLGSSIAIPPTASFDTDYHQALERAVTGKKPFSLFGGNKEARQWINHSKINGATPSTVDHWKQLLSFSNLLKDAQQLMFEWNSLSTEFNGPTIADTESTIIREVCKMGETLDRLNKIESHLSSTVEHKAKKIFATGIDFASLSSSPDEVKRLIQALDDNLQHAELRVDQEKKGSLLKILENSSSPVLEDMNEFLQHKVGDESFSASMIMNDWGSIIAEITRLNMISNDIIECQNIINNIFLIAPNWAKLLKDPSIETRSILPEDWKESWDWAYAHAYLKQIDGREELKQLSEKRLHIEDELKRSSLHAIELQTWKKLKGSLTARMQTALSSYIASLRKIGKGTGKWAKVHRAEAKKSMQTAHGSVPCWIMPHYRVSESLPAEIGMFDLVIVDEASQSDVWALPSIVRGKKLLVVGDDKQVSPGVVGVKVDSVTELQKRFLPELPYGTKFLPGSSLYDLASTMFASNIVRLREHFRSVEPIIAFSNREFYNNEIKPLRVPTQSERLDPPLIDVFVKGGYRDSGSRKGVNPPEAKAIVEEIKTITADPSMSQRTIGVVSLLGHAQAHHIQDLLIREIGEHVYQRHNIRCGDSNTFQGKEADIVFISMVAAGPAIMAQTSKDYEQRFNVACSRARDRMYVYRSYDQSEIKESDLRSRLFEHMNNPLQRSTDEIDSLRDLCDSEFEKQVFDELDNRGYQVTPQVSAGGYYIDLVVEGENEKRLAIECDGDKYHGVDKWLSDIGRQRVLERMGWRFWRCWGSSWFMDKQNCIDDLVITLSDHEIQPTASSKTIHRSALVDHRIVTPPSESSSNEFSLQLDEVTVQ